MLLKIFDLLDLVDLRRVTQVCQTFARLTLKPYLRLSGLPNSSDVVNLSLDSTKAFTALASLARAQLNLNPICANFFAI